MTDETAQEAWARIFGMEPAGDRFTFFQAGFDAGKQRDERSDGASGRERLAEIMRQQAYDGGSGSLPPDQYAEMCEGIADAILAAGFRQDGGRQVTREQLVKGLRHDSGDYGREKLGLDEPGEMLSWSEANKRAWLAAEAIEADWGRTGNRAQMSLGGPLGGTSGF